MGVFYLYESVSVLLCMLFVMRGMDPITAF